MAEENIRQEFRLKNIDETRNYSLKKNRAKWNDEWKRKKGFTTLNYVLATTITGRISISAFTSMLGIPIGIKSSVIGLKICSITAGIKKFKSIIKKKKKKHDKIVLLTKSELNSIEVLISKALTDSNISHDEFVLINDVLNEYDNKQEEIKNVKIQSVHRRF